MNSLRSLRRHRSRMAGHVGWGLAIVLIAVGVVFTVGFSAALDFTNRTEFCSSCHSMQWVTAEYKESIHHNNASGVRAGCADCHVPKALGPKLYAKVMAAKDVYHEILGTINTEEKFEALRWDMASRVWARMRANDSVGCRSCHSLTAMNAEAQSAQARKKHEKAEKEGETCIECHRGVAHEEPLEPDAPEQAAEGAPASG